MGSRASNRPARIYHDLSVMLEAGLPILRALDTVRKGTTTGMARALRGVRTLVSQGKTMAEAMQKYPRVFPDFDRNIIGAAETSGRLVECLMMLGQWYDFEDRMVRRVLSGLILPMMIMTVASFVFPLPSLVLGHIEPSRYLLSVALWMAVFFVPATTLYLTYRCCPRRGVLRWAFDHTLLRVPFLGKGLLELGIARYSRAFNMLYKSGVPIIETLEVAGDATGNLAVSTLFVRCPGLARAGEMASDGFSRRVPSEYQDLWRIGEESGELDRMVDKVTEISTDRADLYLSQFSSFLPKAMYTMVMVALAYMIFTLARGYVGTIMEFMGGY